MNIRLWLAQKLLPKGYEIIDLNVGDVVGDAYMNTLLTQATGPAQPAPKES